MKPRSRTKNQQTTRERNGKRHSQPYSISMDETANESQASQCNSDESEPNQGQVVVHIVHRGKSRLSCILRC